MIRSESHQRPRSTPAGALRTSARNVAGGLRLALGRRVAADAFTVSLGQALLGLGLVSAAYALVQWAAAGATGAEFWIWGLVSAATKLEVWLLAGALFAWTAARPRALLALTVVLAFSLLPVMTLVLALTSWLERPTEDEIAFTVLAGSAAAWMLAVAWRALGRLPGACPRDFLTGTGWFVIALLAANAWLPEEAMFYTPVESAPALDVEAVYYRQPALVEAELRALAPEDPDAVDLYFVGVGAYADQDVFMREVVQVRHMFETEFGQAGHAISLINNRATVWDKPLANRHNLERVLAGLGRRMNPAQDVLVLFVTSHGYDDGSVAVEFEPLGLNDIDAEGIRAALDRAGIRWRIIVISACYSGSFIETLRGPRTLLITAAAHDRASFGCRSEARWTYFGRAYFEQALRRERDFISAFASAEADIERRERREGMVPSRPQMVAGEAIVSYLRTWRPLRAR